MDATPRRAGEPPVPQGRGGAATGTRDDSAASSGAAAEGTAVEGAAGDGAAGDGGVGDGGVGDGATGDGAVGQAWTGDAASVEERRGERMARAERVRRAVEAEGPAGVLGSDLNASTAQAAGDGARTPDVDVFVDAAVDEAVEGAGDGAVGHSVATEPGPEPEPEASAGAGGSGVLTRRERPGRVEYPWRLARFDDVEDESADRAPEYGNGRGGNGNGNGSAYGNGHAGNGQAAVGRDAGLSENGFGGYPSNGQISNGHVPNGQAPNGRVSNGQASNGRSGAFDAASGADARAWRTTASPDDAAESAGPDVREPARDDWGFERPADGGATGSTPPKGRPAVGGGAYAAGQSPSAPTYHHGSSASGAVQLAVGDHLLTVGGPDGSEVVPLPVTSRPLPTRAPVAPRSTGYPPLGRQAEIAELRGLLARGTSVRVGGPAGIGRSTLLKYLASGDAAGAPDGVVVLNGHRRGLDDLLQQFYDACFTGEPYRPTRTALAELLSGVAALVVVDDLDLPPDETEELLRIAPECVFLVAWKSSAEDTDAASRADSPFFEVTLGGLPQEAAFALLARAAGRELDDEELGWAAALWFEVDGHPGRFAQAGALLARLGTGVVRPDDDYDDEFGLPIPELPSPGEPQLFVPRLIPLLSRPAQQVLRLGAALEGVLPDPAHLPALTGAVDAHGAAAELVSAGLVVVENGRHRLAGGVVDESVGLMRGPSSWAVAAIQHFTWWASHPTVAPAQVAEESDVILACLREVERLGKLSSVRVLARAAAPAFASALRFEAWRDCLEIGGAAASASGAVGEQAWFHHELAVLAVCSGESQRAREEATAASRLRDASDKRGLAADRRILVLSGERPGSFGAQEVGSAALGRRRAMSASMAGKRGVMTLGAAGVLVVTLAVVVALGNDAPGSGGGPTTDTSVSVSDGVPGSGDSPVGAVVPPATHDGGAPSGSPSPGSSETATPTGIRSTPGTKSPSATTTTRGATTAPAPPPGNPGVPAPGTSPAPPQTTPPPQETTPPPTTPSPSDSPTSSPTSTETGGSSAVVEVN